MARLRLGRALLGGPPCLSFAACLVPRRRELLLLPGLLANLVSFEYPPSLVAEEEEFVRASEVPEVLERGCESHQKYQKSQKPL